MSDNSKFDEFAKKFIKKNGASTTALECLGMYYYDYIRINTGKFFNDQGFGQGRAPNPKLAVHIKQKFAGGQQNILQGRGTFPFDISNISEDVERQVILPAPFPDAIKIHPSSKFVNLIPDVNSVFGQTRELINIYPINEALHLPPPAYAGSNVLTDLNDFHSAFVNTRNKGEDVIDATRFEIEKLNLQIAYEGLEGMTKIVDPWSPGGRRRPGTGVPGDPGTVAANDSVTAGGGLNQHGSNTLLALPYYRDFSTEYDLPYLKSEITSDLKKLHYVDISSEYNYQIMKTRLAKDLVVI